MFNMDEVERTIHDRQVRYRHEAYREQFAFHPVREWLADRLVTLGEAVRGRPPETTTAPAGDLPHGRFA